MDYYPVCFSGNIQHLAGKQGTESDVFAPLYQNLPDRQLHPGQRIKKPTLPGFLRFRNR